MTISDPTAPAVRVVLINDTDPDPALDVVAMRKAHGDDVLLQYLRTRDPALLCFRDGVEPTWIDVQRLPAAFVARHIAPVASLDERRLQAFRASVRAVGKLTTVAPTETSEHRRHAADFGVEVAPEGFVQSVADTYGAEAVQELGQLAVDIARLRRGARGPYFFWASLTATA